MHTANLTWFPVLRTPD